MTPLDKKIIWGKLSFSHGEQRHYVPLEDLQEAVRELNKNIDNHKQDAEWEDLIYVKDVKDLIKKHLGEGIVSDSIKSNGGKK